MTIEPAKMLNLFPGRWFQISSWEKLHSVYVLRSWNSGHLRKRSLTTSFHLVEFMVGNGRQSRLALGPRETNMLRVKQRSKKQWSMELVLVCGSISGCKTYDLHVVKTFAKLDISLTDCHNSTRSASPRPQLLACSGHYFLLSLPLPLSLTCSLVFARRPLN